MAAPKKELLRARPGFGWLLLTLGTVGLGLGLAVRAGQLPGGWPWAAGGLTVGALAVLARWPRHEPLLGVLNLLILGLGAALFGLGDLPGVLELVGGLALSMGWVELGLGRARPPDSAPLPSKVSVQRAGKIRKVPLAEVVTGDRIEIEDGEVVPLDGEIEKGHGFVDEQAISGSGLPVAKREGERVYAGSRSAMPELVLRAERPAVESLLRLKERAAETLDDALVEQRAPGRWLMLFPVGLSVATVVLLGLRGLTPTALVASAGALLLGTGAGLPGLLLLKARLEARVRAYARGLIVTRPKDLAQLARVRRWHVEPQLLQAGGSTETVELADTPGDTLLAVAEALSQDSPGPELDALSATRKKRKLEPLAPAGLKEAGGLRYGTIDGRRWYLGGLSAVRAEEKVEPGPELDGTLQFLRDRCQVVLLLGRADAGILGALGISLVVDAEVSRAARSLGATLLGGMPDHLRGALAEQAQLGRDGPLPHKRDAALLSEAGTPPSAGLRLRLVPLRGEPLLRLDAAPRIFRPAVEGLAPLTERLAADRNRLGWQLLGAGVGAVASAALVIASPGLPAVGAISGAVLAGLLLLGGGAAEPATPQGPESERSAK